MLNSLRETGGSRKRDTVPFSVITNKGFVVSLSFALSLLPSLSLLVRVIKRCVKYSPRNDNVQRYAARVRKRKKNGRHLDRAFGRLRCFASIRALWHFFFFFFSFRGGTFERMNAEPPRWFSNVDIGRGRGERVASGLT